MCHITCVGQSKIRILDRFKDHLFDIRNHKNTTVARHFASYGKTYSPSFTIHILEYIKVSKDIPRSHSLTDKRELTWIHRLNTSIPNGRTLSTDICGILKKQEGFKQSASGMLYQQCLTQ